MSNINEDIKEFVNITKKIVKNNLRSIILFGSTTKGKFRMRSDYDFLIVVKKYDDEKCKDAWIKIKNIAHKRVERNVDIIFMEKEGLDDITSAFSLEVQANGKTVYGKNCLDKGIFRKYNIKPYIFGGRQVGWRLPT